ncbi:hypothetical protein V6N13_126766 [Hibiscus sabdariffa]
MSTWNLSHLAIPPPPPSFPLIGQTRNKKFQIKLAKQQAFFSLSLFPICCANHERTSFGLSSSCFRYSCWFLDT